MLKLVVSLVFVAGCFSPHFDDSKIQCGPNDECPPGLTCVSGLCRTQNGGDGSVAPAAPMLTSVVPGSPSNSVNPSVIGSAPAGTIVALFSDSACTTQIGNGTAAFLASPGIPVTVPANTTTSIYANATDPGGVSPCSGSPLMYVEDSLAPAAPVLVGTTPASPSRSTMPTVQITAEALSSVKLYSTSSCTGTPLAMATADGSGSVSLPITVAAGSTTQLAATAQDDAGNLSSCSGFMLSYTHDANAVTPPAFTGTTPVSPSKTSTAPTIQGTADANVTVKLYTDVLCSSAVAGTGSSNASGVFSISVTVGANSTTTFYGQATDTGVNSACSQTGITYTHDSVAPAAPFVTTSAPTSPGNSSMPSIIGTAEALSTVSLYTTSGCTGSAVATGSASAGGAYSIAVTLAGTTTYYATATDLAGNTSACSTTGYTYTYDSTAPAAPTLSSTSPASPSSTVTTPTVIGSAENGATVNIYRTSDCSGAIAGSGTATPGFGISITVPSNSTSPLTATATDAAGNVSVCSSSITYVHDSIPPAAPALTSTTPASPASSNTPMVMGTAEPLSTVQLFTDAACATGPIGSPVSASAVGAFTVTVTVTSNASTTLYAHATDAAGNVGACSPGLVFVEDSIAPGAPALTQLPPSNSNTTPTLTGTAEASSTVKIYQSASCGGAVVMSGAATAGGSFGIMVTVTANTSTTFTATATDAAGNVSTCSAPMTYTHDSVAPARPTALASSPVSPAQSTAPTITGSAEANSTVYLFTNPTCSSGVAGTATATGGTFSIPVTVANGSTTTFYATATDAANNTSPCSTAFVTYTQDSTPPGPPTNLVSVPGSPGSSIMPMIQGNAEAGATVKLYTVAGCGSGFSAQGPATGGAFAITVTVTANVSTTFYATATDAAGNVSTCTTTGFTYVEDSIPPAAPSGLTTSPTSPANSTTPTILGTTEANAHVVAYTNSGCTTGAVSTNAAGDGSFAIPVTVAVNSVTTFYLVATDAAGNSSTCNAAGSSITYQDDNSAVATPILTSTTPMSPSNTSTTPTVNGGGSTSGFTIKIYTTSNCTGTFVSGTADASGNFAIAATAAANATTTFYATATNLALTVSGCSSGLTFINDTVAPGPPTSLTVSPASPSNNSMPMIRGTAEAGSTVRLYTNSGCTSASPGNGLANGGTFGITVTAPLNTTTTYWATATDAAGNTSACSSSNVAFTEDSTAPATPTITGSSPSSPSNNNNPTINGTAEPNSTVTLYTGLGCVTQLNTGTATGGGVFGIATSVSSNTATPFYVKATDAAGNTSACSAVFNYVEDATPPAVPTLTSTNPTSPGNSTAPVVSGSTGESGATIKIYGSSNCSTGGVLGTGASGAGGAFAISATVPLNATTTLYATATDAAGNTSACSTTGLSYVEDSIAPSVPSALATTPTSPSKNRMPSVTGNTDSSTNVKLFTNAACTGSPIASQAVPAAQTSFSIQVTVSPNTTTTFYATATDLAGNASACSSGTTYIEDEIANPPVFTGVSPNSPSRTSTNPTLSGTAEASSTVTLYTNATCTTSAGASATVDATGHFSVTVTVTANTSTTFYGITNDLAGNTSACSNGITFISDQVAPTFAGAVSATATAQNTIGVAWAAATDTFTSGANMKYEVCASTTPHGCDSFTANYSITGSTGISIGGLNKSQRYWIQVRAVDQAGNIGVPTPQVEVTAKTFGPGATMKVTAGLDFTCALLSDGTVRCWGANGYGQLGNGTTNQSNTPVVVSGLQNVVGLASGGSSLGSGSPFSCALKADGTVWCWGANGSGQLGNGTQTASHVPVQVSGITNAVQVAVGSVHSCAVLSTGAIKCWGYDFDGELGNGVSTGVFTTPVAVSSITTARSVDAGYNHTCALLADGTARCWGDNSYGQLGNGTNTSSSTPVTVSLSGATTARALDVGGYHACVIIQSGQVRCWGRNATGQLGNATTTDSNVPVTALSGGVAITKVKTLAAGGGYLEGTGPGSGTTCVVTTDGWARCWGYGVQGQLGQGSFANATSAVFANDINIYQVAVGAEHSCFLSAYGTIGCTGNDGSGRLGDSGSTNQSTTIAAGSPYAIESAVAITGGYYASCARESNGTALCWGTGTVGELGDGNGTTKAYPELPVVDTGSGLVKVSMFYEHGCGLHANGTAACWGYNGFGQLGDNTTTNENSPVDVMSLSDAIDITTGFYHSCALIADGTVKCWGYNFYGELGDNTTTNKFTPVAVMGISNAVAIEAQGYATCALLSNGFVDCWGYNSNGGLGNASTAQSPVPVAVSGVNNAMELGAGHDHVCALIAGGMLKCWGHGANGEMGNGTTTTVNSTPVAASGTDFIHIAGGNYTACGIKAGGSTYCWGLNTAYQVGDGNNTSPISTPTAATGVTNTAAVDTGQTSCAIYADGSADCWGQGGSGQCGDGDATAHYDPTATSVIYFP